MDWTLPEVGTGHTGAQFGYVFLVRRPKKHTRRETPVDTLSNSMTIADDAVSYAPSTHTRAKYHQPHRLGGQTFIRDAGNQERALVDSPPEVWRRPPDGRRVIRRCWRGKAD